MARDDLQAAYKVALMDSQEAQALLLFDLLDPMRKIQNRIAEINSIVRED